MVLVTGDLDVIRKFPLEMIRRIFTAIFSSRFTAKPTGQCLRLGLSLGYDIEKRHGGDLKMETEEGEGSEFIIQSSETK